MDEERARLIQSAGEAGDWRRKYEQQMSRYLGSKLKREMIRESHHELGLREIYLPLLDKNVADIRDGQIAIDESFVCSVLQKAKEMAHVLYIEMDFDSRSAEEWEQVIYAFIDIVKKSDVRDMLQRCRFIVYFDQLEKDVMVKELIDRIAPAVGPRNIRMALKFR